MSVYIDFDDVVCETAVSLLALAREQYGKDCRYEEMHAFDLHISLRLSDAEYDPFIEQFHRECLPDIPPVPNACEVIREWHARGFDPMIITGRPPWSYAASRAWLDRYGLASIPLFHVDKYGRFADQSNAHTLSLEDLKNFHFSLAVEDSPVSCDLIQKLSLCPIALFARPWNASYPLPEGGKRCSGWNELKDLPACT